MTKAEIVMKKIAILRLGNKPGSAKYLLSKARKAAQRDEFKFIMEGIKSNRINNRTTRREAKEYIIKRMKENN
jgi:hypothetical protein